MSNEKQKIQLELSDDEAVLINNALNEICNGPNAIEEWEFHARTGSTVQEAKSLLDKIGKIVDERSEK